MKIVVIGSGPCGLVSAISIKKHNPNYHVVLLEKDKDIASRIKISGNGRCNFMNKELNIEHYSSSFASSILSYQKEVVSLLEEVGFKYYFDEQGRGYPLSESSTTLIEVFKSLLNKYQIEVKTSYLVTSIVRNKQELIINNEITCDRLVVAIGGVSYQNERLNYNRIISDLNLKVSPLTPSLTPISVNNFPKSLENKKVKCLVRLLGDSKVVKEEKGEVLFKKDGLSGIVIFNMSAKLARLHLSTYDKYQISLDLLPDSSIEEINMMINTNPNLYHIFIKDLADYINTFKNPSQTIKDLRFNIRSLYEFKYSQVTSGGVTINQLTPSLSLKEDQRIYLGGEFIDIDADCGGYNIGYCMCAGYLIGKELK